MNVTSSVFSWGSDFQRAAPYKPLLLGLRASFLTSFMRVPAVPILLLVTTVYMGINILKPAFIRDARNAPELNRLRTHWEATKHKVGNVGCIGTALRDFSV